VPAAADRAARVDCLDLEQEQLALAPQVPRARDDPGATGVGAVCSTSTLTPIESWPGRNSGRSSFAAARSISPTMVRVASTSG
jgi:hypothetical protein